MTLSLIAFSVSGLGLVSIIGLKLLQQKIGLLLFWPDIREKGEVTVKRHVKKVKEMSRGFNRRNFYIVLHYVLSSMQAFFALLQRIIDKRLVHLVNLIKGKQMIDTRGKASHFLHDVARFKDHFKRQ